MNTKEFVDKYCFHDSLLKGISFDEEKKELTFLIDFCFWAQDYYKEGDREAGMVKVHFKDVEGYDGKRGRFASWTILRMGYEEGKVSCVIYADNTGNCYKWSFFSSDAELIVLPHRIGTPD